MNDYSKDAWKYYEYGRSYNNNLIPNQYTVVNTNNEFFAGNQWIHMPDTEAMRRLAKPTFNIIKRVVSLFVASLTSSNTTISFEPLSYQDDSEAAQFATAEVRNLLEKFKMDYRIRDALFDGAVTGDYAAHFYWNPDARPYGGAFGEYKGEIEMEMVDGINIMFGNPNCCEVEKQPYILVVGRDTVENLKREAQFYAQSRGDFNLNPDCAGPDSTRVGSRPGSRSGSGPAASGISCNSGAGSPASASAVPGRYSVSSGSFCGNPASYSIRADSDYSNFSGIGGRTELHGNDDKTGKALYVYLYTKVWKDEPYLDPATGMEHVRHIQTVHVTKATRSCNIFEDIDTGLTRYPIAWGNWQKQKNQYHGRALVTEIIPNQIFINQMMAMVFRHLQTQAFPTKIYNADLLPNISNEVGTSIAVRNLMPGQGLGDVISTIPAANMSAQIIQAIDLCMTYTKECLGATDAQLGNVSPDNTSALMVLQNASEVPLENTRAGLHEWIEDIGAILLDMMGTYYGVRPIVRERDVQEPVLDSNGQPLVNPATGQPLIDPMTGQPVTRTVNRRVVEPFDFSVFKKLWLNVSVDVGATTYYSEIAMVQTLDNLRHDGTLDIIEYLERMPDKLLTRKQDLIDSLKQRMKYEGTSAAGSQVNAGGSAAGTAGSQPSATGNPISITANPVSATVRSTKSSGNRSYTTGGEMDVAKRIAQLPTGMQAKYNSLPRTAQRALVQM